MRSATCRRRKSFELLDALSESLEADELSLTEVQRDELDYRLAPCERNLAEVIPLGAGQSWSV